MPSTTGRTMSEAHDDTALPNHRLPISQTYDWSKTTPTTAVVETVAAALDREATELDLLGDAIDPDALNAFVEPDSPNVARDLRVSFAYHGYTVSVEQTGRVALFERDR